MVNELTPLQLATEAEGLLLHQALHGYADGHRLLQSSISIPDELNRLMLRMSDLSGSSVISGFENYLTGYPLPSLDAYALAKTWYASEMSRPGCVWTHTLVISASVMARITSLYSLMNLFRRPNGQSAAETYAKPVPLDSEVGCCNCEWDSAQRLKMQAFITAHYHKDSPPVIIAATNADEYTDLIFAAWSQKWPALRMRFTFCTGSLSARTFEKHSLAVQCVPTVSTRLIFREVLEAGLGAPILMQSTSLDFPQWSTLAANDALRCEGGPIRSFLWSVADEDSTPADFESFVIIYDGLNQSVPISSTVELTADLFPRATDGQRLKRALLGDQKAAIIPPVDSKDMLFALATTRNIESFDPKELHLTDHASFLQKNHPALGCRLIVELFRASLNDIGDQILTSLILAARPDDVLLFAPDLKQFLPTLFRVNPKLATSAQLWLVAGDRKRELFESLIVQSGMEPEIQSGIVGALLNSGSDAFLGQTFAEWGGIAVANALEWIEAHDGTMSEMCRGALTSRVADVMDWVTSGREKSAATLIDVAHVVAPYSTQIAHYDSTIWLRTLHAVRENHQEEEANYISAFLLALALCNASPAPLDLVSESFERIHQLQEKDDLADSAWIILQSFVPELSWRKNWDKCERLRRALISAFMRHNWPAHQLRERIKNRELVKQLLKSARKVGGEQYFDHC